MLQVTFIGQGPKIIEQRYEFLSVDVLLMLPAITLHCPPLPSKAGIWECLRFMIAYKMPADLTSIMISEPQKTTQMIIFSPWGHGLDHLT